MTVPPNARRVAMTGRYLMQNRAAVAVLSFIDAVLQRVSRASSPVSEKQPRRILLHVGGHLGDAVMATAALSAVRRRFPNAEIGVLTATWNRPVLESHPAVARMHFVDHWKLCRSGRAAENMMRHRRMKRVTTAEIRAVGYDVAVDLYPFFPNAATLLHRAGIPARVGYSSGGFGPLFTLSLEWPNDRMHMTDKQLRLLDSAFPANERFFSEYDLPVAPGTAAGRIAALRESLGERFVVLHPGAGASQKMWNDSSWAALARGLIACGLGVVITGAGERDRELATTIADMAPGVRSLVDVLEWSQFVAIIDSAALVVSVDTVAGHVAAARRRPFITLFTGINDMDEFRPLGETGEVVIADVPCAPCFIGSGCPVRTCISGVTVAHVLERSLARLEYSNAG